MLPLRILICLAALVTSGCALPEGWVGAHFSPEHLGPAASPFNEQHLGSLALLATTPFFSSEDRRLQRYFVRKELLGSNSEHNGDVVMGVLMTLPLLATGIQALRPEGEGPGSWEIFEVAAEATILNYGLTEALKHTVQRERPVFGEENQVRPGGPSKRSFPSGHVSAAMTGATITGRWLRSIDRRLIVAEAALYAGVVYVAISRLENTKHFPTDTIAGAILGGYVANTVWDAHFGTEDGGGIFNALGRHVLPVPMEDGVGLLFYFEF